MRQRLAAFLEHMDCKNQMNSINTVFVRTPQACRKGCDLLSTAQLSRTRPKICKTLFSLTATRRKFPGWSPSTLTAQPLYRRLPCGRPSVRPTRRDPQVRLLRGRRLCRIRLCKPPGASDLDLTRGVFHVDGRGTNVYWDEVFTDPELVNWADNITTRLLPGIATVEQDEGFACLNFDHSSRPGATCVRVEDDTPCLTLAKSQRAVESAGIFDASDTSCFRGPLAILREEDYDPTIGCLGEAWSTVYPRNHKGEELQQCCDGCSAAAVVMRDVTSCFSHWDKCSQTLLKTTVTDVLCDSFGGFINSIMKTLHMVEQLYSVLGLGAGASVTASHLPQSGVDQAQRNMIDKEREARCAPHDRRRRTCCTVSPTT